MYNNNNNNNNQYPTQQNYGQPQQQQGQGNFWPGLSGFTIGPSKNGKSTIIKFSVNAFSQSKKRETMVFQKFMADLQKAFEESNGYGVHFTISFNQGMGPRGPFTSASISVQPKKAQQQYGGGGYNQGYQQNGGGRTQYPPAINQQGYAPQNGYGQSGPTQPQYPAQPYQQAPQAPQHYAPPPVQQPVAQPAVNKQAVNAGPVVVQTKNAPSGPPVPSEYTDEDIQF